jgi:hypothetical protein
MEHKENIQLFQYSTPLDMLERLNRQFQYHRSDSLNEDKALDFCLTAWSLTDWDFYAKEPNIKFQERPIVGQALGVHREKLYILCPALRVMSDIANGTKHFFLERPKAGASSISSHTEAGYSTGFSHGYNRPYLKIIFKGGGESENLNVLLERVSKFWNSYLKGTMKN